MNKIWSVRGSRHFYTHPSHYIPKLENKIYTLDYDDMAGSHLTLFADNFSFPYKVYGIENEFINRVIKSWNATKSNMGILLNGLKGTGKTVTAEMICNKLNLPVIIIRKAHPAFVDFLSELNENVIVFIDEFEKVYRDKDETLLSIMDGVLNKEFKKFFLLTTNTLNIDRNLIQRPSRIRYIKTFEDMKLPVIMEVVNDILIHKEHFEGTVKFISELPMITMDLVKSIVNEVNVHNEDPENFREIFNVHGDKEELFNVFQITEEGKVPVGKLVKISPKWFYRDEQVGNPFHVGRKYMGEIIDVVSDNTVKTKTFKTINEGKETEEDIEIIETFTFEPAVAIHKSFSSYYAY